MPPDKAKEIIEKDSFVLDLISERFKVEWNMGNELDGKASSLAGFVGIIISLQVGFGTILIDKIPKTNQYHLYLYLIYFLGIGLLIISILCYLRAYRIQDYCVSSDPEKLIKNAENVDLQTLLRGITNDLKDAISINEDVNDNKAKNIEYGFISLILGIIVAFIFSLGIIILLVV